MASSSSSSMPHHPMASSSAAAPSCIIRIIISISIRQPSLPLTQKPRPQDTNSAICYSHSYPHVRIVSYSPAAAEPGLGDSYIAPAQVPLVTLPQLWHPFRHVDPTYIRYKEPGTLNMTTIIASLKGTGSKQGHTFEILTQNQTTLLEAPAPPKREALPDTSVDAFNRIRELSRQKDLAEPSLNRHQPNAMQVALTRTLPANGNGMISGRSALSQKVSPPTSHKEIRYTTLQATHHHYNCHQPCCHTTTSTANKIKPKCP